MKPLERGCLARLWWEISRLKDNNEQVPIQINFSKKQRDYGNFALESSGKTLYTSSQWSFLMVFFRQFRSITLLLLLAELVFVSGCVRRRLTIRTNPPGAVAYLDNAELGKTPISRNFDYYGKRELKLVKEGYEPHVEMIHLRAPWYQWPGLDFISEVLIPGTITDERIYPINLKPQQVVSPDDLVAEGERMKAIAHSSGTYRVSSGRERMVVPQSDPPPSFDFEIQPTDSSGEQLLTPPPPHPTSSSPSASYLRSENLAPYSFNTAPTPHSFPAPEPRI